jgi:hypothetical protein
LMPCGGPKRLRAVVPSRYAVWTNGTTVALAGSPAFAVAGGWRGFGRSDGRGVGPGRAAAVGGARPPGRENRRILDGILWRRARAPGGARSRSGTAGGTRSGAASPAGATWACSRRCSRRWPRAGRLRSGCRCWTAP